MPRQKDEIWKNFNETVLTNGTTRAVCKICKSSVVGLVSRMKTHYDQYSIRHRESQPDEGAESSSTGSAAAKVSKQTVLPFLPANREFKHELNLQITRYA